MPDVTNWTELAAITSAPSLSYTLTVDLDSSTSDYTGIGDSWTEICPAYGSRFLGTFDGNGHTISDIIQTASVGNYPGLFGMVWGGSLIKNVGVINASFSVTKSGHGIIAGGNWGTVQDCYSSGCSITVTNGQAGGIAGYNSGTVSNCWADSNISNSYTGGTGGIVGLLQSGSVTNCLGAGTVSTSGNSGGVIGQHNGGSIVNCGWHNTSGPTYAVGSTSASVTHETATLADFYDATHNLYDNQTPYWDFTTPIWYEHAADLPDFVSGGTPDPVTGSPAIMGASF